VRLPPALLSSFACVVMLFAPSVGRAEHRSGQERIDFTAYTLRSGDASVGIGAASYGVLDELTVGTYLPPWFAFPLVNAPIASGFVKLRDWYHGPIAASLRAGFVHLPASALTSVLSPSAATRVGFFVLPLELSLSLRVHPRFSQSLQLSWVHVAVNGSRPREDASDVRIGGASAVTSVSLSSLSEARLTAVVAITLRCNVLLGNGDLVVNGKAERDGTRVDARLGSTELYDSLVANVIPGVAFSWSNINLQVGLGVGSNWLPFVGLPIRGFTLVPDADFYVRF
jgi:hypothetical protein